MNNEIIYKLTYFLISFTALPFCFLQLDAELNVISIHFYSRCVSEVTRINSF